jgi:dipeptidyl aminopeptidase/acylaminoacyl peptidase
VLAGFALLAFSAPAQAAFPGQNGKMAVVRFADIYVTNGVDYQTNLTNDPATETDPAWSADGNRIAFTRSNELWTMLGDGTEQQPISALPGIYKNGPAWSPDGRKIAFAVYANCGSEMNGIWIVDADGTGQPMQIAQIACTIPSGPVWSPDGKKIAFSANNTVYTINPDGSGQTNLTPPGFTGDPSWSPDGQKIAFASDGGSGGAQHVWTMNADGSGASRLTNSDQAERTPAWSPDGTKIAFVEGGPGPPIYTVNPDGTGLKFFWAGGVPDWQPLPINYYARPKGATPVFTSLTVAYKPCSSGNRVHGPPLAADSCSPPVQTSDYLTVGTLDANGQKANATAWVGQRPIVGNPSTPTDEADVKLTASLSDVRHKDLSDYAGELQMRTTRRITDKDNTPSPGGGTGAATVQDLPFAATIPCAPTSDTTIGSLCELETTADTLVPGSVKEGLRSIWELSQVLVYDGGSDGQASTSTDNTLFMDEGIFVP